VTVTLELPEDGGMLHVLKMATAKFKAPRLPQHYCIRKGIEVFGEDSSLTRLRSRVAPGDVIRFSVLPEIQADELMNMLRTDSDLKAAAFLVRKVLVSDSVVGSAFVLAGGIEELVGMLSKATGNTAVYTLQALLSGLSTREGKSIVASFPIF
jgi:hypothetical protein